MTLKEHIEDQKHRYQTVSLSLEQADIVLKLIDGAVDQAIELAEKRVLKRKITNCKRERLLRCEDNNGNERIICEKCSWEPAANDYCYKALSGGN